MGKRKSAQAKVASTFRAPMIGDAYKDVDYVKSKPIDTPNEILEDAQANSIPLLTLISMALKLGHDPKIVCGVPKCTDHTNWLACTDRFSQTSTKSGLYHYGIDIVWCRQCLSWQRDREPQALPQDYIVN
jgi:hypothetical protein